MNRQRTLGPDPVRARAAECCRIMTVAEAAARFKLVHWREAEGALRAIHPVPAEGLCPCGHGLGTYARIGWTTRPRGQAGDTCPTCAPGSGDVIDLVKRCTAGTFDQACTWIEQTVANVRCGGTPDMFGGR